jgi:polyhydroxybutyrate depolymerase
MKKILLIGVAAALATTAHAANMKGVTLKMGDYDRSYVYTTTGGTTDPVAVVLVLPDSGEDGATALERYRWSGLAAKEGFVAVGLDALPVEPEKPEMFQTNPYFWSDGSGRGNAHRGDLDDVAYVNAVLGDLSRRIKVDSRRVYATGFGNGASMVHRLGMQLSDRIVAIAPVSGYLWNAGIPDNFLPVMMIYGSADPVEPIRGGYGINMWTHQMDQAPATTASAVGWVQALGCKTGPTGSKLPSEVTQTSWSDCAGKASVDYIVVPGQGHHWPGGVDDDMSSLGPNTAALDATPFIWDWFKNHSR